MDDDARNHERENYFSPFYCKKDNFNILKIV
jgi:hypothetical protein